MGRIGILDESTYNKIAAGEVVERPASVVKELVENSMDAGASAVSVEIKNGGISFIRVVDNGSGMDEDDARLAFERHATSKIKTLDDLYSIRTLGFRGEALTSIAAVSKVELNTRTRENTRGSRIEIHGGKVIDIRPAGCPAGTSITVRELFYNTPARYKFLKKDATEAGHVSDIMNRFALARPDISFKLVNNGVTVLHTPGNSDLKSAIFSVYGSEAARNIAEIDYSDKFIKVWGYAGKPELAKASRNYQSVFVNGRYVKSRLVFSAIDTAYETALMKNRYAFVVLHMELNPMLVDVNVHPTKIEIKFSEEQEIFKSLYHAIVSALQQADGIRQIEIGGGKKDAFRFSGAGSRSSDHVQGAFPPAALRLPERDGSRSAPVEDPCGSPGMAGRPVPGGSRSTGFKEGGHGLDELKASPEEEATGRVSEKQDEDYRAGGAFSAKKIVGQVFSTYIILEGEGELILVDQHAAHERIVFERLKKKFHEKTELSQALLSPPVIRLTDIEIKLLQEEKDFFNSLGFDYEDFGNNSIILRAVPYECALEESGELFLDVLGRVLSAGIRDENRVKVAEDAFYQMACKSAVKANKRLSGDEIKALLEQLDSLDYPFTCPHGRPVAIRFSKNDLERMFKRKL